MQKLMARFTLLLLFLVLFMKPLWLQGQLPSSPRAKKAIERCKPILKKQLNKKGLSLGAPVFIRIIKKEDALETWMQQADTFVLFKTYRICSYSGGLGPKKQEGDMKSPEGFYYVTPKRLNPYSSYHLSFNIGYPNTYDRSHGYTGSYLMVHGNCVSIGCYAMTNSRIEEIYTLIYYAFQKGQAFFRIHIFPFRMDKPIPEKYRKNKNYEFWKNLREGWQFFETHGCPPNVYVENKQYAFEAP